jgi:hypothetical protein
MHLMLGEARTPVHPKNYSKLSQAVTNRKSVAPSTFSTRTGNIPDWPAGHPLKLAYDFHSIGTKWQDELMRRTNATRTTSSSHSAASRSHSYAQRSSEAILRNISSLLHDSNPRVDPERLNDFFNGLDFVAEHMLHQL